jgi:hypothetical protein
MEVLARLDGENIRQERIAPRQDNFGSQALSQGDPPIMKTLRLALAAAAAAASAGLASLATTQAAMNEADCPDGWYWDNERQNCLPPGLPKDPPRGCLTGDGTHFNGTVCIN